MSGINKVIIIGNVGAGPEVRHTADGRAIANVSVATSQSRKDKNTGEKREQTEWHKVIFFNRLAEIVQEYVAKGSQLYIEGRLQTRKWTDKDGNDRYSTEIVCHEMQMLGGRNQGGGQLLSATENKTEQTPAKPVGNTDDFDDDSIPF